MYVEFIFRMGFYDSIGVKVLGWSLWGIRRKGAAKFGLASLSSFLLLLSMLDWLVWCCWFFLQEGLQVHDESRGGA
jgi:hypothetical protein